MNLHSTDMAPAKRERIQAIKCRLTLKLVRDMIMSYRQKLTVFDIFLIHGLKKCSNVIELFFTKNTLKKY